MAVATVTGAIVFSDIAGFTRFTRERGDTTALALLERFEAIVRSTLPDDARVVKLLGDGILTFVPDATAALLAAVRQQGEFARIASADAPLWVRTGLHHGSPLVRGDDLIGHDVNLASRVADQALPGEVLATEDIVVAAGSPPGLAMDEVGPVFVKGVDDAVRLFRVAEVPIKAV